MFFRTINPWESEGLKRRLLHYYRLLNEASTYNAYYRICKRIPAEFSKNGGIKDLWKLHEEKKAYFEQNRFSLVEKDLNNSEIPPRSFLDLKIRLACQMLKECDFCERKCGIDRSEDETGYCGVPEDSYLSSKFLHHGEEPVLVPSGTIFFGGCNLGCVFCQNADISNAGKTYELSQAGNPVSAKELADIAGKLVDSGALNVNYVGGDPIPNLHTILEP